MCGGDDARAGGGVERRVEPFVKRDDLLGGELLGLEASRELGSGSTRSHGGSSVSREVQGRYRASGRRTPGKSGGYGPRSACPACAEQDRSCKASTSVLTLFGVDEPARSRRIRRSRSSPR